jgi:hypothetical protein
MKRVLLLLLVFVMLVPVPCFASSIAGDARAESSCSHIWDCKGIVLSDYCYVLDDYKHNNQYADKYQCVLCFTVELRLIQGYYLEEAHSKHYQDIGHVSGEQLHLAIGNCSKCSWMAQIKYFCPGPPCIYLNALPY